MIVSVPVDRREIPTGTFKSVCHRRANTLYSDNGPTPADNKESAMVTKCGKLVEMFAVLMVFSAALPGCADEAECKQSARRIDEIVRVYMSPADIAGAGWNHGRFGTGRTNVIE